MESYSTHVVYAVSNTFPSYPYRSAIVFSTLRISNENWVATREIESIEDDYKDQAVSHHRSFSHHSKPEYQKSNILISVAYHSQVSVSRAHRQYCHVMRQKRTLPSRTRWASPILSEHASHSFDSSIWNPKLLDTHGHQNHQISLSICFFTHIKSCSQNVSEQRQIHPRHLSAWKLSIQRIGSFSTLAPFYLSDFEISISHSVEQVWTRNPTVRVWS